VANALLEDLEVEMRIGLNLQRELKSGELGDTLDILIYRDKYEMSYFNYSGGERFIIDLVLRIALSILLLRRKGCGNSTLIIDEGMGNLDKFNREKFLKLISIVNEKYSFKKAIIISHISDIQDNIGKKIKIVKYGNTSSIEV
jgi:exonuclease SbcC